MLKSCLRKYVNRRLAGQSEITLEPRTLLREEFVRRFEDIEALGVYLHIPFCKQICSYCPYNKELYCPDVAAEYAAAVKREIDFFAEIVGNRPVTSLYVGGGSPTTMLRSGLADMLPHIRGEFDLRCDIHMESHLNDLREENLDRIQSMGVEHLSLGVESLQERHLRFLGRPYSTQEARNTVRRVMCRGFKCVNVDLMFALPGQTCSELQQAVGELIELGVNQVATYPLFYFPYTRMGSRGQPGNFGFRTILRRWKQIRVIEQLFYSAGYERSSVWAFTKRGVPKYCSVTVPLYLGLGASGGSYLNDIFFLNTFNVEEYIRAIQQRKTAIALSLNLSKKMQMAGWLYWRIYETRFCKTDFFERFGQHFDQVYGKDFKTLRHLGFAKDDGERITLTDRGTFWLHALEDVLSIEYISRLWGTSKQHPWPQEVPLA